MARRSKSLLVELAKAPWWLSVAAAIVMYVALRLIILATLEATTFPAKLLHDTAFAIAPYVFILFLVPVPFSLLNAWRRKRLLAGARDAEAVRSIPWHQFEMLIAEAFRRIGYQVEERGGAAADGGVDLVVYEAGKKKLVQCKRWNRRQVGVAIVRELCGVMTAESADGGIIVTGGSFTVEAELFAAQTGIELVNGEQLQKLLSYARGESSVEAGAMPAGADQEYKPPLCPKCATAMVVRTARRGTAAGSRFWGCARFPVCNGTRPAETAPAAETTTHNAVYCLYQRGGTRPLWVAALAAGRPAARGEGGAASCATARQGPVRR